MFCSQFLGYEVYRHPALAAVQYVLRLDDDVNVAPPGQALMTGPSDLSRQVVGGGPDHPLPLPFGGGCLDPPPT